MLALHANKDRPAGESSVEYYLGFAFTLASSALFALMLPLIELTFKKAKQSVTYSLVMEIQLVLSFSATVVCTIGMLASGDYKVYSYYFSVFSSILDNMYDWKSWVVSF